MATFSHISGAEPSTITFKAATVSQTRNSSLMHQEIISIGDPESSLGLVAVLGAAPASTTFGMVVRRVGDSTSIIKGDSTVFQGGTWTVTVQGNSTVAPLAGSLWTVQGNSTVAPLAGSTWNTRPIQSSAADLQMTATPAAGSTWRTQPGSTLWASSAGFHFDSSGGLQISGAITASVGSTVSTGFLAVRISDGSTWVVDYAQGSTFVSTLVGGGVNFLRVGLAAVASTDTFVMPWASTAGAQVMANADSSGAIVLVGDSANNALRVNVVAGAAAGSTIVTVAAFGTGLISSAVQAGGSSALTVRNVWSSSNADQPVSAVIASVAAGAGRLNIGSTAADNAVAISGNSTAVISAFAAALISSGVAAGNSSALTVRNVWSSTNTDQPVSAAQAGTWTFQFGTGLQSTVAPSSNSSGIIVRQVVDNILTTASTSVFAASTSFAIQSSGAGLRSYVTSYSILTTNAGPTKIAFYSSGTMVWPLVLAAVSSAVTGANLAVSPPGYLFRTANQEALTLQTKGSTIAGWSGAVSYFRAP